VRWDQVVGVTGVSAGSGYLIAPRLVLTSAHVVGDSATALTVFRMAREGTYTARVVWCGRAEGTDDAALVEIDDPEWSPPPLRPVIWGRSVTHEPRIACRTWGLPDFAQRAGKPAETEQPTGTLNPGDGLSGYRHILHLTDHPPAGLGDSPWKGISGAAVYCGDLLTGVVATDLEHRAHAALGVVPAYVLLAQTGFRAVVEQHAGPGGLRREPVELQGLMDHQSPLRDTTAAATPASLLLARRAVVPFRPGRKELLAELADWAAEPGPGVWLLHGAGGQGKTRLAHYFGEELVAQPWSVLWLDPDISGDQLEVLGQVVTPLLVIIDYAETRTRQVVDVFDELATHVPKHLVKVLLLARTVGDWWHQVAAGSAAADKAVELARVTALPPLDTTAGARHATYRAAVEAFANALARMRGAAVTVWEETVARVLAAPYRELGDGATALGVQMSALVDLLDSATASNSSGSGRSLEDRVLVHERRYWNFTADEQQLTTLGAAVLQDAVAATVVLEPVDAVALDGVLERIPELSDQPRATRGRVRDWLMGLYPGQAPGVFGGLAPDRIADHLVGRLMLDRTRPCVIEALAAATGGVEAEHLLTVCARAAAHPALTPQVGERLTDWCVRHPDTLLPPALQIATQVETPAPLIAALDQVIAAPTTSLTTLRSLHDLFPEQTQVLGLTAADLTVALVARLRSAEEVDIPVLAGCLNNLAGRLGELGRHESALVAIEEAVELYRVLAGHRPDDFRPDLAGSLHNLAIQLGELGRREEALGAAEEVVELYRVLAGQRPEVFRPGLADSLHNLAIQLGESGRRAEALIPAEEAVELYRVLAGHRPDDFRPGLAGSLQNLAIQLGELGRREEALLPAEEAVEIHRVLAGHRPDAFRPGLAGSLHNLAIQLGELGRHDDALLPAEETVEIYRLLVVHYPERFRAALERARQVVAWLSGEG